jgi:DNA-binding NarL/FixJ family response regulator
MKRIRVALVDDHRIVRSGLRSYLESFPDIEVTGSAGSGEEALAKVLEWRPDVVIMDLRMPGGVDGIEATRRIRSLSPDTRVVVLTAHEGDTAAIAALRAGACGYMRKDAEPELFLAAVRGAAQGRTVLDPAVTVSVMSGLAHRKPADERLTARETEVLLQVAHGRTNREIGQALHISEETVKTHVANVLAKLGLSHRSQAVACALKRGLLSLDAIE